MLLCAPGESGHLLWVVDWTDGGAPIGCTEEEMAAMEEERTHFHFADDDDGLSAFIEDRAAWFFGELHDLLDGPFSRQIERDAKRAVRRSVRAMYTDVDGALREAGPSLDEIGADPEAEA